MYINIPLLWTSMELKMAYLPYKTHLLKRLKVVSCKQKTLNNMNTIEIVHCLMGQAVYPLILFCSSTD